MPPRLLLIAQPNSYRIAPHIRAARDMGMETLIASRGEYSLVTEVHRGLHIDLDDPAAALGIILAESKKSPFCGVLGCDDSTVELAAAAAAALRLPHNPPQAARISSRKDLARARLLSAGCPVPRHRLIDLRIPLGPQAAQTPYPCVLKPLHLSAGRGVIRADNARQFTAAARRIRAIVEKSGGGQYEQSHLLAEEYIPGIEVAFEGYLRGGELHQIALFDKPDPLTGPYFEETIYVAPSRLAQKTQSIVYRRVAQACAAYGLSVGPVHAELRINNEDAWILEAASRAIGGDCARALDGGRQYNIETLAIALATDRAISPAADKDARGVMMLPVPAAGLLQRVEGISAAAKVRHIEKVDINVAPGQELVPLPEGNQYPGTLFARADKPAAVITALRQAHQKLKFVVRPVWRIR